MSANTWDALTRASWGEVGVTSMNQVFLNNTYYQANYLPGMLGWISLKATNRCRESRTTSHAARASTRERASRPRSPA